MDDPNDNIPSSESSNGAQVVILKYFQPGTIVRYGREILKVWGQEKEDCLVYNERGMIRVIPAELLDLYDNAG